jgi:hypothetical protein
MNQAEKSILEELKGCELSAVVFVRDYLQLQFDGPYLTIFVWPRVKRQGTVFERGTLRYRDALCEQIGKAIGGVVEESDRRLSLFFTDGSIVEISLLPEDRRGPEAVLFRGGKGRSVVW